MKNKFLLLAMMAMAICALLCSCKPNSQKLIVGKWYCVSYQCKIDWVEFKKDGILIDADGKAYDYKISDDDLILSTKSTSVALKIESLTETELVLFRDNERMTFRHTQNVIEQVNNIDSTESEDVDTDIPSELTVYDEASKDRPHRIDHKLNLRLAKETFDYIERELTNGGEINDLCCESQTFEGKVDFRKNTAFQQLVGNVVNDSRDFQAMKSSKVIRTTCSFPRIGQFIDIEGEFYKISFVKLDEPEGNYGVVIEVSGTEYSWCSPGYNTSL